MLETQSVSEITECRACFAAKNLNILMDFLGCFSFASFSFAISPFCFFAEKSNTEKDNFQSTIMDLFGLLVLEFLCLLLLLVFLAFCFFEFDFLEFVFDFDFFDFFDFFIGLDFLVGVLVFLVAVFGFTLPPHFPLLAWRCIHFKYLFVFV